MVKPRTDNVYIQDKRWTLSNYIWIKIERHYETPFSCRVTNLKKNFDLHPKKLVVYRAKENSIFVHNHHANFFTLFWINSVFYRVCHIDKSSQYNNQEYNIFAKQKPIRCLSDNGLIMLSLIFMFLLTHIII